MDIKLLKASLNTYTVLQTGIDLPSVSSVRALPIRVFFLGINSLSSSAYVGDRDKTEVY